MRRLLPIGLLAISVTLLSKPAFAGEHADTKPEATVDRPSANGAPNEFACGCERVERTGAQLVVLNLTTGKTFKMGKFGSGKILAYAAEAHGTDRCLDAIETMPICTGKHRPPPSGTYACSCDAVPQVGAKLLITELTEDKHYSIGPFAGGGFFTTTAVERGTAKCLRALKAQAVCAGTASNQ